MSMKMNDPREAVTVPAMPAFRQGRKPTLRMKQLVDIQEEKEKAQDSKGGRYSIVVPRM